MNKIQFKTRKEVSAFLKERNIDTTNWTEEKWQSINKSQAEIHIQAIAEMMWDSYNESKPNLLQAGEWHIPYGDKFDMDEITRIMEPTSEFMIMTPVKIATARCARISYTTLGNNPKIDYEADIKLHDRLRESKHLSCFEHCAKVMNDKEYYSNIKGIIPTEYDEWGLVNFEYYPLVNENGDELEYLDKNNRFGWCNNFRGFIQYRHIIENK